MKKTLNISEIANLIGLILISLLIWFAGPFITINGSAFLASASTRLGIISFIFIFWIIKIISCFLLDKYANQKIINKLTDEKSEESVDPQALKKNISLLIKTLQKQSLWHSHKKVYTSQVPLFLIMGSPSSGKTSILQKAGMTPATLDTTVQNILAELKKINAGNWWLTQEGIFLEIDTTTKNTTILTLLLSILKRNQFCHALHGIILVQDAPYLLSLTEEDQVTYTQTLQIYLFNLYQSLKIRVPIYLLLSKMDQIDGFCEYFSALTHAERECPLGYLIQESDPASIQRVFSTKHDHFISQLQTNATHGISSESDSLTLGSAINFPRQLYCMKNTLQNFLKTLFSGAGPEKPYTLFGLYFSSAASFYSQPTDYYFFSLQKLFRKNQQTLTQESQTKTYFLKGFFKKHIFGGIPFIVNKQRRYKFAQWARQVSIFSAISLFIYFVFSCFLSDIAIHNDTENIVETLSLFPNKEAAAESKESLVDVLPFLEPIRITVDTDRKEEKWYRPYTQYTLGEVQDAMEEILEKAIIKLYIPLLYKRLEILLENEQAPTENLIKLLKVYLALGKKSTIEHKIVREVFSEDIRNLYKDTPEDCAKLMWYLDRVLSKDLPYHPIDPDLVKKKQDILKLSNPLDRIYQSLKAYSDSQEPRFLIPINAWDPYFRQIFKENQTLIPSFYTENGYAHIIKEKSASFIERILLEDLHLGLDITTNPVTYNKEVIHKELTDLYFHDFLTQWQDFLQTIRIAPTTSLKDIANILNLLTGKNEGLLKIITFINREITSISPLSSEAQFKELCEFAMLTQDKGLVTLQSTITNIGQFAQSLTILINAPDTNKACFLYAKSYQEGDVKNPIYALKETASKLPSPLKDWIYEIIERTWLYVIQNASQYIETTWKTDVYETYEKEFCQTYPFLEKSQKDLELATFKEIFGENGTLKVFFTTCLKPFLDMLQHSPTLLKDGTENAVLPSFYATTASLQKIQSALSFQDEFIDQTNKIMVSFQIESFTMDPKFASLSFSYAGEAFTYRHGPSQYKKFNWSDSNLQNNSCEISGTDFTQQDYSLHFEGFWSIFKLIDSSAVKTYKSDNKYILTLPLKYPAQIVIVSPKLINFLKGLRNLHLPKSLDITPGVQLRDLKN